MKTAESTRTDRPKLSLLVKKDRFALAVALGGLVGLSWWYLYHMNDMSMHMALGVAPWRLADFVSMFLMWAVMMVAMMVPTTFRSILIFAAITEQQKRRGLSFVSSLWFTFGYIIAWTGFSLVATGLQWRLDQAALMSPQMALSSPLIGAAAVIFAGLWQLSPLKDACLRHCRTPAVYLAQHFRPGHWGATRLGLLHGLYCLGCCWLLMGLLFVGGVMNLAWVLVITLFVLIEKCLPPWACLTPVSGVAMVLIGVGYLAFTL
jgi:predicted metal-binding membrane protein